MNGSSTTVCLPGAGCARNGVTHLLPLYSNGMTGRHWYDYLQQKGIRIELFAFHLLRSPQFRPSRKGTRYDPVIVSGSHFSGEERQAGRIARRPSLIMPDGIEFGCLLADACGTADRFARMGFGWIAAMHKPVESDAYGALIFGIHVKDGVLTLDACLAEPGAGWRADDGFAFDTVPRRGPFRFFI